MSLIYERIEKIMHYYGLNKSSFSKIVGFNNNVTLGRIINYKKEPSLRTLNKIKEAFPDLSPEWLLTGRGSMLRSVERAGESPPEAQGEGEAGVCAACEDKERVIAMKDEMLRMKDKQIEDLKGSMERLISSKDEMLAMKDEVIKGRDEMISVLKGRIEDLERDRADRELKKIWEFEEKPSKGGPLPTIPPKIMEGKRAGRGGRPMK